MEAAWDTEFLRAHAARAFFQESARLGLQESLDRVSRMTECVPFKGTVEGRGPFGLVLVSDEVKSINYFLNMPFVKTENRARRRDTLMNEFVWDPIHLQFATILRGLGLPRGSPHESLARAIGADESVVCGGIIHYPSTTGNEVRSLRSLGYLETSEFSGHYGDHWTDPIRAQYKKYMQLRTGLDLKHFGGYVEGGGVGRSVVQ